GLAAARLDHAHPAEFVLDHTRHRHRVLLRCAGPGGRPPGTPRCASRPAVVLAVTPPLTGPRGPGRWAVGPAVRPLSLTCRRYPVHHRSPSRRPGSLGGRTCGPSSVRHPLLSFAPRSHDRGNTLRRPSK